MQLSARDDTRDEVRRDRLRYDAIARAMPSEQMLSWWCTTNRSGSGGKLGGKLLTVASRVASQKRWILTVREGT